MLIPEEWSRLLSLANLSLSEEEKLSLRADLESMVAFAEKLGDFSYPETEKDTSTQSSSELRPDILAPSLKQEIVLQNAPEKDEAFFLTRGKF